MIIVEEIFWHERSWNKFTKKKKKFFAMKISVAKKNKIFPFKRVALVGFYILFYSQNLNGSEQSSSVVLWIIARDEEWPSIL